MDIRSLGMRRTSTRRIASGGWFASCRWRKILVLLFAFGLGSAASAESIDLDRGWSFWLAKDASADAAPVASWFAADPVGAEPVEVPYSWNTRRGADADGIGWYARALTLAPGVAGAHLELHFDAVFYRARIWVNGVPAGAHEGGHTGFDLDVSRLLRPGANRILVAADDRPGFATIPGYAMRLRASGNVWYDWWRSGGITRDVSLRIAAHGLIRRQRIRQSIGPAGATIVDAVAIENVDGRAHDYRLTTIAIDPDGREIARSEAHALVSAGAGATATTTLAIPKPQLWAIGAGRLYRIVTQLRDEGELAIDRREDRIGLHTIAIRDRRLFVNDVPVRLTGVTRHEDSPWEGGAETRGTILHDWRDLAALHVTLTRPVHYPQPQAVLDAADRAGMLLIPEIPVWQMTARQLGDPRLVALAKAMMAEMIAESGNHPSVLAWSVMNESDSASAEGLAYVRAMKAQIRALDPDRFVTFADSDVSMRPAPRAAALGEADFVMANAYFGSWSGPADAVGPWLDAFDRSYPDKMLVVSEFGWPGPFSKDSRSADAARQANLTQQLDAFAARPFVAGAIFWSYQDYRSNKNLFAGLADGEVDHGLVDADRQRRPSFAVWEARNRAVSVSPDWMITDDAPAGFTATIAAARAGALPSYPLIGARLRWRAMGGDRVLLGEGKQALPTLPAGGTATVSARWAARALPVTLSLDVLTADGTRAGGVTTDYVPFKTGSAPYPPRPEASPKE